MWSLIPLFMVWTFFLVNCANCHQLRVSWFEVYGPKLYHKGNFLKLASFHSLDQIVLDIPQGDLVKLPPVDSFLRKEVYGPKLHHFQSFLMWQMSNWSFPCLTQRVEITLLNLKCVWLGLVNFESFEVTEEMAWEFLACVKLQLFTIHLSLLF